MAQPTEKPGRASPAPLTHRNEFPTGYSLAGCSPAEPASASPADLILQPKIPFAEKNSANGSCRIYSLSHGRAQSNSNFNKQRRVNSYVFNNTQFFFLLNAPPLFCSPLGPEIVRHPENLRNRVPKA